MDPESGQQSNSEGSPEPPVLPLIPGTPDEYYAVLDELKDQTDRGAAVLGCAYLEWRVVQTIQARLYRWEMPATGKKKKQMGATIFGSDKSPGKLGFEDKCRMAYCLGLVGPGGFRDMERLAQIRNKFAHNMSVSSFGGNEKVRKLCEDLEGPKLFEEKLLQGKHKVLRPPDQRLRRLYMETIEFLWMNMYDVARFSPVEWPDPAKNRFYW